jgi:hypothetical protein
MAGQAIGHGAPDPQTFNRTLLAGCDVHHPSTYIKGPLEESLTHVH